MCVWIWATILRFCYCFFVMLSQVAATPDSLTLHMQSWLHGCVRRLMDGMTDGFGKLIFRTTTDFGILKSHSFFFKKRKLMTVFYSLQQTFGKHLRCSKNIKNEQIYNTIYAYSYTTWAFKIILTVRQKFYLFLYFK